jgi:hypothetical protein
VKGEGQRYRGTTYVEILGDHFKKNAIRIDSDGGCAKKESQRGNGNDPPAIENASGEEGNWLRSFHYESDSDDAASCLRGRVAPGRFSNKVLPDYSEKSLDCLATAARQAILTR